MKTHRYTYGGYTFVPVRPLTDEEREMSFKDISMLLSSDGERRSVFSRYDGGTYSHSAFYAAMHDDPADIFHCVETGLNYIPGDNELFVFEEAA